MAIYRYTLLRFPLRVNDTMTKIKYGILFSLWLVILIFWTIYYGIHYNEEICTYEDATELKISAVIVFYFTPLTLILSFNVFTIFELRKRNKTKKAKGLGVKTYPETVNNLRKIESTATICNSLNIESNKEVVKKKESDKNHSRRMFLKFIKPYTCLFLVSITTVVCFTPYSILAFKESWSELEIYSISYVCTYLIGIFNPIFIFMYQDSFKNVIKNYFKNP